MSEQGKPTIIQSLEKKLGLSLSPGPAPALLVRDDYALQYVLDEKNQLIGLNLAGCELKNLELGSEFQHLQVLNVGRTALRSLQIPAEMKALRELRAYECKELEKLELPDTLAQLHYLDLSECALTQFQLPDGLLALKTLYLQKNKLQNLSWESDCPVLEFIDLSQNQLSSLVLPDGLPKLRFLYLNDNGLSSLQSLGSLPALQVLHLRNNQLEELPLAFVQGEQMETLYLHNNPLSTLPQEIIESDERKSSLKEVRDYLLELNKGKNIINDRAKLIIVGNGRVGKTSICKQLQGAPFDPNEKYTHGIQIGKLTKKELPGVATSSLQLNVWDFGGQEIFYATHQFFLSDEAIYLLAWTNNKNVEQYQQQSGQPLDEKWRKEEYWLDNIRRQGPSSPILMVQTHSDQYKHKLLPEAQYQEAPYAVEFLDFSANKGYGLEQLKDFIVEKLQTAVPMYGKEFPQSYERVIDRMEKSPENFISLTDFLKVCQESDITPGTESTVLSYLHKSGVVVHFDQEGLKEVVYTNPNWLTQQVYRLINNELAARAGRIDRTYLEQTLPEYDEQKILRFVELLKTFKLIFAAEGEEGVYIASQYLNRVSNSDKRNLYESHKEDLELSFVFRFPKFMPDNVMVNFLSTYGPYSRKEYWRDCIFFRKNKLKCIVDLDEDKQELRVYTGMEAEAWDLQAEICAAFVDLSKSARAEISLDGQVFASWQELKREYSLYLHNPAQQFFAVDQKTPLQVKDFLRFFERGELSRFELKRTNDPAPKQQTMPTIKSLIQDSRLKEALKALETKVPNYLQNEVILQQSRLNGLERQERSGTISREHADIERAKIRGAILSIYEDAGIKEVEPEPIEETENQLGDHRDRDTDDGFGDQSANVEIPPIEPFEGSLTVPKGEDGKTKILFLTANPADQQNLAVDRESKLVMVEAEGKALEVVICPHIDRGSMINMVAFRQPQIVHFSGHGKDGSLAMIDPRSNKTYRVENEDLVEIFSLFKDVGVKCVVLCSCWSFSQAKVISELGIPVIGMLRKIGDEEAIQFSRDLYYLLMSNNPLERIFKLAKLQVTKASREIPSLWYNGKRIA